MTIMLGTGDIGRFERVGGYTSYCHCVRAIHTSNGKRSSKNGNTYRQLAGRDVPRAPAVRFRHQTRDK
ncbi:MAG: hypothetical protein JW955_05865 [Sedimentisphaerales bacterium]|nr:hypothetical protein [Sedimentisphaerales bacterium]